MAAQMDVAVIGAGASGLAAAYLASKGSTRVTLYEAGSQLGGHANTVEVSEAGRSNATYHRPAS